MQVHYAIESVALVSYIAIIAICLSLRYHIPAINNSLGRDQGGNNTLNNCVLLLGNKYKMCLKYVAENTFCLLTLTHVSST